MVRDISLAVKVLRWSRCLLTKFDRSMAAAAVAKGSTATRAGNFWQSWTLLRLLLDYSWSVTRLVYPHVFDEFRLIEG